MRKVFLHIFSYRFICNYQTSIKKLLTVDKESLVYKLDQALAGLSQNVLHVMDSRMKLLRVIKLGGLL